MNLEKRIYDLLCDADAACETITNIITELEQLREEIQEFDLENENVLDKVFPPSA